ncbi:MAG: DNA repair protein RadC [Ruminococcaceae bacterium]|nr:DNA repair protein RadC [Oscillospiraceae bacterium]
MSIHDGHRQRLKERYQNEGLDGFTEVQVLELLLFYCIPRQDTNPIAHALLNRFGSLAQVLDAPVSELQKVSGMGKSSAAYLTLFSSVWRYYQVNLNHNVTILSSIAEYAQFLIPKFYNRRNEVVILLCLDAKGKVLSCKEVGEGSVNSAAVPIRRIVEMALADNASMVVLAHNHPSGLAIPSGEDQLTTHRLAVSLSTVDIELVDHLVVADGDYVSLRNSGWYHPDNCVLPY